MIAVVLTNAESRGRHGPADDKDRSPFGTAAASWPPPRVPAGCRDCGTHGNRSSPAPRSPRTSGNGQTGRRATNRFHTTAPPIVSRAGSRHRARLFLTRRRRGWVLKDRSVPFHLHRRNGNDPPDLIS